MHPRKKCNICGKTFKDIFSLNLHTRVHTGERPFKCSECPKEFSRQDVLKEHMVVHLKSSPFQCKICSKFFPTTSSLKKHEVIHSNPSEWKYKCESCDKRFYSKQCMNFHYNRKHNAEYNTQSKPFECTKCDMRFDFKITLANHQVMHTGERRYQCSQCDKTFVWKGNLNDHVKRKHETKKKETCKICGAQIYIMKLHLVTHETDRPFICEMCGKSFKRARNLCDHLKIHLKEKPEICLICGGRFQNASALRTHMRVKHLKPLSECVFCQKLLKGKGMEGHMKLHTHEKPCICQYCGEEFMTYNQRVKHRENCTKG